jgi:hypothetical protein
METQKEPGPPPTTSLGPAVLPYSLDIVSDYLAGFTPPDGPFDPRGEWDHRYVMWIALRGQSGKDHKHGALRIRRAVDASGIITLSVSQTTGPLSAGKTGHTTARITCRADRLATPRKWEIESRILDAKGKPVPYSQSRVTGEVAGGEIVFSGTADRRLRAPKAFTGSWSLFDAVQRLPFDSDPVQFDMLDDLELMKPRQRLAPGPAVEVALGGGKLKLHSFEQTGDGILPYSYWLDDQHRLLAAVGGVRTFIWDPTARLPEDPK